MRLPLRLALPAAVAALAGAIAAPSALAAVSVLPPGQNGLVTATDLAGVTSEPHSTDQLGLFERFGYKAANLGLPGAVSSPRPGVTISRDAAGVPSVTGATTTDTWFGAGYALAVDRLFQMEVFRRAALGSLAEILGPSMLDMDLTDRRDYYTGAELDGFFATLTAGQQESFRGYADGINARIREVSARPDLMPAEFAATNDLPIRAWTVRDSVAIGVYLARTTPAGGEGEADSLAGLTALRDTLGPAKGEAAFDDLLPVHPPGVVTSVPKRDGTFASVPGRTAAQERAAFKRSVKLTFDLPPAKAPSIQPQGSAAAAKAATARLAVADPARAAMLDRIRAQVRELSRPRPASNGWAVRDPATRRAWLYTGPQLGFTTPSTFAELEIHGDGVNARGATIVGVPVVGIGHNEHVAWALTSGLSDTSDLYIERLDPNDPNRYRYRGAWRTMESRTETFKVGGLGTPPSSVTETIRRTVHGPVLLVDERRHLAYARRYATWRRELETLQAFTGLMRARTAREADAAWSRASWNENLIAADDQGNISFRHPGLYPRRPVGYDERLPYPGDGSAEWRGLLRRDQMPHVLNPKGQNWVGSWNTQPSAGWTSGDGATSDKPDGPLSRSVPLFRALAAVSRRPTTQRVLDVGRTVGTHVQAFPAWRPFLARAAKDAPAAQRAAWASLLAFDGSFDTVDAAGTTAPGLTVFEKFRRRVTDKVVRRRVGAAALAALSPPPGTSHAFDSTTAEGLAFRTLTGTRGATRLRYATNPLKTARDAMGSAVAELTAEFGTADVARWRRARATYKVGSYGAGSLDPIPFFDRGTFQEMNALAPDGTPLDAPRATPVG